MNVTICTTVTVIIRRSVVKNSLYAAQIQSSTVSICSKLIATRYVTGHSRHLSMRRANDARICDSDAAEELQWVSVKSRNQRANYQY